MTKPALTLVDKESGVDKQKALETALGNIERSFGKGSVMRLGDKKSMDIEAVSTGSLGLDIALGIGGLPKGRIIEIFGPESSGKTTLSLHCVAEAQKNGGVCAFIDAEHALDPVYAGKLGVDLDDLLVSQPDSGEQALEIADTLVRSGAVDLLVIDSVAALTPRAELEGEMGDQLPGLQARLMSQALRKLTGSISKSKCMVIFINQIRMKIGVMFGNPETTTGGNALKFYASVREYIAAAFGDEKLLWFSDTYGINDDYALSRLCAVDTATARCENQSRLLAQKQADAAALAADVAAYNAGVDAARRAGLQSSLNMVEVRTYDANGNYT